MTLLDLDPAQRGTVGNNEFNTYRPPEINGSYQGKDIVTVDQFTRPEDVLNLFAVADDMSRRVENREALTILRHATVVQLFYQPSTRTSTSFEAASKWLGCQRIIGRDGMTAYSSAVKGESLPDTVKTIEQTTAADLIILRHPDDNSSEIAAASTSIPIINAGSGRKEHPTQALLDLYTVQQELGRMDDLTVTMTGDLRNGRTIKSLAKLLTVVGSNIRFNFISPDVLRMPDEIIRALEGRGASVNVGTNGELDDVIPTTDVLYVTRIQSEWFTRQATEDVKDMLGSVADGVSDGSITNIATDIGKANYERAVEGYVIDNKRMQYAKPPGEMIVMHPLPRVNEISQEVDADPRAAYFRQMRSGLYTRMALLSEVLGG
jgi:aspartate carbamoyltransferase